jgi:methylated-DNA-[protein]-cysteine S-methyltransferase
MSQGMHYKIIHSHLADIGIVWYKKSGNIKIIRILLAKAPGSIENRIRLSFPGACTGTHAYIASLCDDVKAFLSGKPIVFSVRYLDLTRTTPFQRSVILLERKVPRGRVSTYGRLARKLGYPFAGRTVGQALAKNPFPIIIPCHRVIRSDRSLGGFIGGIRMKQELLELEGIKFDKKNRVLSGNFW